MGFRKPFRAVPVKPGPHYRRRAARKRAANIGTVLAVAVLGGTAIGVGSTPIGQEKVATAAMALRPLAVSAGLMRARAPQTGDQWSRCDEARAAGTAPIYAGEPGYREGLDGDGDGEACEPYPRFRRRHY